MMPFGGAAAARASAARPPLRLHVALSREQVYDLWDAGENPARLALLQEGWGVKLVGRGLLEGRALALLEALHAARLGGGGGGAGGGAAAASSS